MTQTGQLLTREEVADYLGVPRRTLDSWAYRGGGPPFFKVGRHTRYRIEDIVAWLEDRRQEVAAP